MGKRDRRGVPAAPQALLDQIHRAFDGVPAPDADHRTLRQAEAWDSYTLLDQRGAFRGRWQELPVATLLACPNALPHLDAQGIRYYLPAVMCADLQGSKRQRGSGLFASLRCTLQPATGDLKGYQRARFRLLTEAQRAAICAFVAHIDAEPGTQEAWRRVVEAGDDPEWPRRFY